MRTERGKWGSNGFQEAYLSRFFMLLICMSYYITCLHYRSICSIYFWILWHFIMYLHYKIICSTFFMDFITFYNMFILYVLYIVLNIWNISGWSVKRITLINVTSTLWIASALFKSACVTASSCCSLSDCQMQAPCQRLDLHSLTTSTHHHTP